MRVRWWLATAALALAPGAGAQKPSPQVIPHVEEDLPPGVSEILYAIAVPPSRRPTPQLVTLGEKLFKEKRLSSNGKVSCETCHEPELAFTDHKPLAEGVAAPGMRTARHSPTVLNALFNETQFWDGRAATLEDQAKLPITNPVEMGLPDGNAAVARLKEIPEYPPLFRQVFGRDITFDDVATAIAAFERMQYSGNAAFDRFIMGDAKGMSPAAQRGWALFNGKARCNACHQGSATSPLFTDQKFHNIGIAAHKTDFVQVAREAVKVVQTGNQEQIDKLAIGSPKFTELGRFLVTKHENDVGAFKTPTLRNVGVTAPYMHDGSLATLFDVMDHYNKGGVQNPFLDGGMQRLGLSEAEISDVVEFLFALTDGRYAKLQEQEHRRQLGLKGKRPERDEKAAMGKTVGLGDIAPQPARVDPARLGAFGRYVEPENLP